MAANNWVGEVELLLLLGIELVGRGLSRRQRALRIDA